MADLGKRCRRQWGMNVADGIKIAHQLSLRWKVILTYLQWGAASVIKRVFIIGRGKQKRKNWTDGSMKKTQPNTAGLEDGRRSQEPMNLQETRKDKKTDSSLEPSKGMQPY